MGTKYLIDSNVIIGYLDNKLPEHGMQLMNSIIDDVPRVSVITKIELLRYNATPSAYQILNDFIDESIIFNLNDEVVDKTIAICKQGKIKLPDAIIAATALVHNFSLVTRNVADFKKISGLTLFNPWEPSAANDPL